MPQIPLGSTLTDPLSGFLRGLLLREQKGKQRRAGIEGRAGKEEEGREVRRGSEKEGKQRMGGERRGSE